MSDQPSQTNSWDAQRYDGLHSFVWKHGADLIEVLAPKAGERILDLGCGTGHLTAQIAAVGADVHGIDRSDAMVDQARGNYPAISFAVGDAREFQHARPFDAVFSNAVLHWIKPPADVARACFRALRSGGRFVVEFGGAGNVGAIADAIRDAMYAMGQPAFHEINPWYYPTIGEYASVLEKQKFGVTFATLFDRPTPLEGGEEGLRNWVKMFGGVFLATIAPARHEEFFRMVEEKARPLLFSNGQWSADYRRIRVVAVKP